MAIEPEMVPLIQDARLALLFHLVRLLMRDRAIADGQQLRDVMDHAEQVKQFFERGTEAIPAALMTAAVDDFFNMLAADVAAHWENPGG